jgi:hypothetical protein
VNRLHWRRADSARRQGLPRPLAGRLGFGANSTSEITAPAKVSNLVDAGGTAGRDSYRSESDSSGSRAWSRRAARQFHRSGPCQSAVASDLPAQSKITTGFAALRRRGGAAKGPGNWLANEAGFGWQTQEHVQEKNSSDYSTRRRMRRGNSERHAEPTARRHAC